MVPEKALVWSAEVVYKRWRVVLAVVVVVVVIDGVVHVRRGINVRLSCLVVECDASAFVLRTRCQWASMIKGLIRERNNDLWL